MVGYSITWNQIRMNAKWVKFTETAILCILAKSLTPMGQRKLAPKCFKVLYVIAACKAGRMKAPLNTLLHKSPPEQLLIVRWHRHTHCWMRTVATDVVAWSVCLYVGHQRKPCKNG